MKVLELMKTHVVRISPEATLGEAVDLMDLYQTNGLPVVDSMDRLCGMLTENDVLRALFASNTAVTALTQAVTALSQDDVERVLLAGTADKLCVSDFMTQPAVCISEHADLRQAAHVMLANHLKRLPVIDEAGKVIGVLNRIDIYQNVFMQVFE